ncbi:hypothetical protein EV143_103243 [Flavobacterium chryseum]|uniref:hypothetical protein n=1 Tax=Flavobacterium sp. P3160 TaxID=2512113 RepID=UPI00105CAF07|nr:hypothetical protein [Flavobacterium sp. P3160]TDO78002.1 hypothetical protein EV143_103243 [Flavobacterium sp. P3160]
MKKVLVFFFVFHSIIAICQDRIYYLEGTLGKSKIYMKIEVYKDNQETSLTATYFYQNSLKDIQLKGAKNDSYTFYFKPNDVITEKFYLKKDTKDQFQGLWYNSAGKQFPVQLQPIDFSNYKSNLDGRYADDKLNLVKCKFLEFKKQKTTSYKNKEFVWYSEKHCESDFFRLGNNFSDKNKAVINPILEKIHIENTLDQLNCTSSFEYSEGKGIEGNSTINFLNQNLLGFQISNAWDCGGAHPDFGSSSYLIDLNNGKNYEIDDILAFDKSVTTEKGSDFSSFSKYRSTFFAPKLLAVLNSVEYFVKPKDESDPCDYTNEEYWDFPSWNFTEQGIEFTPIFARVERSCEEPFLAPFEKLKKYKNPKFPYNLE